MPESDNHTRIIALIKAIASSFPDAPIIFQFGACYSLYRILKTVFPEAECYETKDNNHIVTKIDGKFYDIRGEMFWRDGSLKTQNDFLPVKNHSYWENVIIDRRVEKIISIYNSASF